MDFSTVTAITIPEGSVTKIENSQGVVLWNSTPPAPTDNIINCADFAAASYSFDQNTNIHIYEDSNINVYLQGIGSFTYDSTTQTHTIPTVIQNESFDTGIRLYARERAAVFVVVIPKVPMTKISIIATTTTDGHARLQRMFYDYPDPYATFFTQNTITNKFAFGSVDWTYSYNANQSYYFGGFGEQTAGYQIGNWDFAGLIYEVQGE